MRKIIGLLLTLALLCSVGTAPVWVAASVAEDISKGYIKMPLSQELADAKEITLSLTASEGQGTVRVYGMDAGEANWPDATGPAGSNGNVQDWDASRIAWDSAVGNNPAGRGVDLTMMFDGDTTNDDNGKSIDQLAVWNVDAREGAKVYTADVTAYIKALWNDEKPEDKSFVYRNPPYATFVLVGDVDSAVTFAAPGTETVRNVVYQQDFATEKGTEPGPDGTYKADLGNIQEPFLTPEAPTISDAFVIYNGRANNSGSAGYTAEENAPGSVGGSYRMIALSGAGDARYKFYNTLYGIDEAGHKRELNESDIGRVFEVSYKIKYNMAKTGRGFQIGLMNVCPDDKTNIGGLGGYELYLPTPNTLFTEGWQTPEPYRIEITKEIIDRKAFLIGVSLTGRADGGDKAKPDNYYLDDFIITEVKEQSKQDAPKLVGTGGTVQVAQESAQMYFYDFSDANAEPGTDGTYRGDYENKQTPETSSLSDSYFSIYAGGTNNAKTSGYNVDNALGSKGGSYLVQAKKSTKEDARLKLYNTLYGVEEPGQKRELNEADIGRQFEVSFKIKGNMKNPERVFAVGLMNVLPNANSEIAGLKGNAVYQPSPYAFFTGEWQQAGPYRITVTQEMIEKKAFLVSIVVGNRTAGETLDNGNFKEYDEFYLDDILVEEVSGYQDVPAPDVSVQAAAVATVAPQAGTAGEISVCGGGAAAGGEAFTVADRVVSADGNAVAVSYAIANGTDAASEAVMILAAYDGKDKLLGTAMGTPAVLSAGNIAGMSATFTKLPENFDESCTIRAFVWQNTTGLKPLLAPADVAVGQ